MTERDFQIYFARVCLAQCRVFRRREVPEVSNFFWTLLAMAREARRKAEEMRDPQGDLFA